MLGYFLRNRIIIIYGPTAVGKTDFADQLAAHLPIEIINADLGQFYTPLSIGTAKPDWRNSPIPQHLFDIINQPSVMTVTEYRDRVARCLEQIWARKNTPVLVGGSGFYIKSLFFPPHAEAHPPHGSQELVLESDRWRQLYAIDPQRALSIHPHDLYRINRALSIYFATGQKPSECRPRYQPLARYCFVSLTRDRQELYDRINRRVVSMLEQGWIAEVQRLLGTEWQEFLIHKKIIGYDDIISYLHQPHDAQDRTQLIQAIAQKTRNYAKRQVTFGAYLRGNLQKAIIEYNDTKSCSVEFSLTNEPYELYINQLLKQLEKETCFDGAH